MTDEAKQEPEEKEEGTQEQIDDKQEVRSEDEIMDSILDQEEGKEKPGASSAPEETTEKETDKEAESDGEPDSAKKEDEADKETKIPEEFHKHEAWKRIKESEEKALKELEELKKTGGLSEEDKALMENVKQFTSSREFLEDKYKKEGYTDEVVAEKLTEAGFDVQNDESDLDVAAKALGVDVKTLSDEDKNDLSNLVKVSNALIKNNLGAVLPKVLSPIAEQVTGLTSKEAGFKIHEDFVSSVKKDGILDYQKDLAPDISKYLDDNPKAVQEDVAKFMQDTYHEKLVLYKKAVEKKDEREKGLEENRPGGEGSSVRTTLPSKTGDFDKDANALFDHMGVH